MNKIILKNAVLNALGTALYIAIVVSLIFFAPKILGSNQPETILIPIGMLCLFVFSAALTGFLVFGRPILWYLDGKKKEAVYLLCSTLAIFLIIIILVFLSVLLISRL